LSIEENSLERFIYDSFDFLTLDFNWKYEKKLEENLEENKEKLP